MYYSPDFLRYAAAESVAAVRWLGNRAMYFLDGLALAFTPIEYNDQLSAQDYIDLEHLYIDGFTGDDLIVYIDKNRPSPEDPSSAI